jgi:hypothetical protein
MDVGMDEWMDGMRRGCILVVFNRGLGGNGRDEETIIIVG